MKIVGELESKLFIPFKVWRKFAFLKKLKYESWEEGAVVLLDKEENEEQVVADFK